MDYLTVEEVASILGISRATAYRLVEEGAIRHLRVTKRLIKIPRDAMDEYMEKIERKAG